MRKLSLNKTKYLYHYSPKTGKPERCHANSADNCPYKTEEHGRDLVKLYKIADLENTARELKYKEITELIRHDWSKSSPGPNINHFLTNEGVQYQNPVTKAWYKNPQLDKQSLVYLGLFPHELDDYENSTYYVIPKGDYAVSNFLSKLHISEYVFKQLKKSKENGALGNPLGTHYKDYYLFDSLRTGHPATLDTNVKALNPRGEMGYTLRDVWNDFISTETKQGRGRTVTRNGQEFFIMKSPKLLPEEKGILPTDFGKDNPENW